MYFLRTRIQQSCLLLMMTLLAAGCSGGRTPVNEKPVTPVSGVVHVDGEPIAGVRIDFHAANPEKTHRVFPRATTDAEGRFQAWSYRKGDGLAAGTYTMTFLDYSAADPRSRDKSDGFEGRYAQKDGSTFTLTVDGSDPIEMDVIELSRS